MECVLRDKDGNYLSSITRLVTNLSEGQFSLLSCDVSIDNPDVRNVEVTLSNYDTAPVYFDDLKIQHTSGPIVQENHLYAYGLPMPELSWRRRDALGHRYGYQGLYSRADSLTGYNSFDLRMYDARVGRWLSKDPYGQYASSYTGMGNDPVNGIDPDGGFLGKLKAQLWTSVHGGNI